MTACLTAFLGLAGAIPSNRICATAAELQELNEALAKCSSSYTLLRPQLNQNGASAYVSSMMPGAASYWDGLIDRHVTATDQLYQVLRRYTAASSLPNPSAAFLEASDTMDNLPHSERVRSAQGTLLEKTQQLLLVGRQQMRLMDIC